MLTDYAHSLVSLISSIETYFGLSPRHATLGALDELLDRKYTNTSEGKPAAKYNVAGRFLPYETVIEKLGVPAYFISPYSEPKADGIESLFCEVSRLCAQPGLKYIYGYSPLPDYDMHDHGTAHPLIHEHLKEINARLEALCNERTDSLIIVTADHGMTDTEFIFMDDHPEVKECILREPSIEGRAMSLFIKPEYKDEFPARFNAAFGNIYELIPHGEAMGLFGDGTPHPLSESFIGDFLAVAKSRISIGYEFDPDPFKAAHAGDTVDEVAIPFIAVRT